MFNVCVEWFRWTIGKEATHGEFAVMCREIVAFFVDDWLVRLRDLVWLQSALNIPVTLFKASSSGQTLTKIKS